MSAEFPKTLKPEPRYFDRRYIAGKWSTTLTLRSDWEGRTTGKVRFGLYGWNGKGRTLDSIHDSRDEARKGAAHLRRRNSN
jgi:hypothetical protein